jgi:sugar phosphate isomerase/epimerase
LYLSLNGTLVARRLVWADLATVASVVGFDAIDVLPQAVLDGPQVTNDLLSRLRLRPAILWLPVEFRKDEAIFESTLRDLEAVASTAVKIGCPRMTASIPASSDQPKAELLPLLRERLQVCAKALAARDIRLGLEFLSPLSLRRRFRYEFIYRMDEALDLAHSCGENVGLTLDSWHWHWSGATAADIESCERGDIVHVHLADGANVAPEEVVDSERLMPGEGVIDLVGFFQALRRIGYDDGVSPEVFGRGLDRMLPEEGARLGLETSRRVMRQAGVL